MADEEKPPYQALLTRDVKVVSLGLEGFIKDLRACDIEVVHVDWVPPASGDPQMAGLLAKMGREGSTAKLIEKANRQAVARILEAEPKLIDIVPAREALYGLKD